jgi:hypothetical protein
MYYADNLKQGYNTAMRTAIWLTASSFGGIVDSLIER